jgi:hypothetical protein
MKTIYFLPLHKPNKKTGTFDSALVPFSSISYLEEIGYTKFKIFFRDGVIAPPFIRNGETIFIDEEILKQLGLPVMNEGT